MRLRLTFTLLPFLAALALSAVPTALRAGECTGLRIELASLSDRIGSTAEARKYARAIASQTFELRKLKAERQRLRCGRGSITRVGSPEEARCEALDAAGTRMQANLDTLKAKRQALSTAATSEPRRAELMDRLATLGCNDTDIGPIIGPITGDDAEVTAVSAEADMTGREVLARPLSEFGTRYRLVDLGGVATGGGLKTMCVRTCDGAFFPISSHAGPTSFQRDAQVCSMMCPGTETELFYQPLTSDDAGGMISTVTGRPYRDIDNAFLYRATGRPGRNPACGCNLSAYHREMMRREQAISQPAEPATNSAITWVKPDLRKTLGPGDAAPVKARPVSERPFKPDPKIRKVGPVFLPDEDDRIDLGG